MIVEFFTKCNLVKEAYANGGVCLQLYAACDDPERDIQEGEPVATCTSWLPGLAEDEVAVKDYSENKGMLDALIKAGAVCAPHRFEQSGFVRFPICKLVASELEEELARVRKTMTVGAVLGGK